jgi:ATP-binding cassette, subfamily C, bacterial
MALDTDPASARAGGRAFLSLMRHVAGFAGRRGVLALVYVAVGAVFESFGLVLIIPLVTVVIGGKGAGGRFQTVANGVFARLGVVTPFDRLALVLGGFAAVMIVRGMVITMRDRTMNRLQVGFVEDMRGSVAAALAGAGWSQVLRLRHARVLTIMSSDIQRIASSTHFMLQAIVSSVILLVQVVLSFWLSPALALFSLALLIVAAVAMIPVLRRARNLGRFVSEANHTLIDTASQFLNGLKLALSQDLQDSFVLEFRQTLRALTSRQNEFFVRQSVGRTLLTTLSAFVGAAVVLVGYGVLGLSAPILFTFLLVVARMSGPATQIQQGFQQLAHGLPSYEAIMALLGELRAGGRPAESAARVALDGPVVLDGVGYQHPHTDDSASHGVRAASLTVEPGTILGLAGSSGAGKTTLADLLVGLLRPQTGRILIGGTVLDEATLPSWRAQLSYISQDPFLFHDTIRRNMLWAKPNATETEMWEALAFAGADGIVKRMDGGLDAIVGERGSLVSGGERQRIALARAVLRKPRLLLMDEATNAIDVDGERRLLEKLAALEPRPTIVMIAHRAESMALCDRVVRMQDGQLYDDAPTRRHSQDGSLSTG